MKIQTKKIAVLCAVVAVLTLFCACTQNKVDSEGRWEDAVYLNDTEFGKGSKTVVVEVKVGEESVDFIIHSDKTYLGDALLEHELIEGEESQFGIYIKKVNGIVADYDIDKTYWGFYKNGEQMMSGVSTTEFADGEHYELVLES